MPEIHRLEILDRQRACREGTYLRLETLRVRNHYDDGTASDAYACDYVVAPGVDAVAVILFYHDGDEVYVGLLECIRPPVTIRRDLPLVQPDEQVYLTVTEVVAGRLEPGDDGEGGISRRAAIEAREEAGFEVNAADAVVLGGGLFSSPGQTPEKVYFRAFEIDPVDQQAAPGDGSPMEGGGGMVFLELHDAICRCVSGEIEDPKAEIGFRRLADYLEGTVHAASQR